MPIGRIAIRGRPGRRSLSGAERARRRDGLGSSARKDHSDVREATVRRAREGLTAHEVAALLRLAPLATTVILVLWVCAIGFRARWWSTGRLDAGWDSIVNGFGSAPLEAMARTFAGLGTGVPALLEIAVLVLLVFRRRGTFWAAATTAICAVSSVDVMSMKAVAQRLRPDGAFGWQNSFPSGHTTFAALLMTLTALLVLQGGWRWLAMPYPLLMAWSRTQLHAHWMSDVLAGVVLGAATAVVLVLLAQTGSHLAPVGAAEVGRVIEGPSTRSRVASTPPRRPRHGGRTLRRARPQAAQSR